MASFKVGNFTTDSSGTPGATQSITGLGFQPKALICFTAGGLTADTARAGYRFSFGFSDGTAHRSYGCGAADAVNPTNTGQRKAGAIISIVTENAALVKEATVAFDSDGFTLTWGTNDAVGYVIHYLAIGGAEVSAKVLDAQTGTGLANVSVTGVGFQPACVFMMHTGTAGTGWGATTISAIRGGIGMATGAANEGAISWDSRDNVTPADTQNGQTADRCYRNYNNSGSPVFVGQFISMDADGFTFDPLTAPASDQPLACLCLAGFNVSVIAVTKSTGGAPASQAVTGVGFDVDAVLWWSFAKAATATFAAPCVNVFGATDGVAEESACWVDVNGGASSDNGAIDSTTKVFREINAAGTDQVAADITSLDSDGFTVNWTTNNATAYEIIALAMGTVPAAGDAVPVAWQQYRRRRVA